MNLAPELVAWGLPALFLVSFLAATVLPLGSEWLVVALLLQGQAATAVVLTATAGNLLGASTTYALGRWGGRPLAQRWLRQSDAHLARAEGWYCRYGCWSLLASWLPVVGDPLCLLAGLLRCGWQPFLFLAGLGKCGRYALLAWLTPVTQNLTQRLME